MPRPAHELLNPTCTIKPAWAVFDRHWYLRNYADARAICSDKLPEAALLYYLRVGVRLGHSPSALFDEQFYLTRNKDIAALVRAGNYQSGFDHFCQHGYRVVSPHWLFDDELYGNLYEDMTLDNLDQHHCYGRYDHYLKSGQRERRMGQFLFDGVFYKARAMEAGVDEAEIDTLGPYVHFLNRLGSQEDELPPSCYFDPNWYVEHHPGAKGEIARGRYASAIHHYLNSEIPQYLDPVPQFSETFYRQRHPDIAAAIEQGFYRSAYQQFIQYGAFELRQPSADIDLVYYRDMHESVRNDLNSGAIRDAFAHLRIVGLKENLAYHPPDAKPTISESATREQFLKKARANLALFARRKLDFSYSTQAVLSVIMVVFNRFELTMLALGSLRDNFHGAIEVIIVDNDSTDNTKHLAAYVVGAKIIKSENNIGFLRACNKALQYVSAPALLFLNNDVELAHGAIETALARFNTSGNIGAVGGKVIRTNGLLQEAGSIIWQDGTTKGYMRDSSPLAAQANFVRDVDYCSGVFLLCRTALIRQFGGFDESFAPAYFEDVDLCVRIIESGHRVVYDPGIAVHHLEFGSATTTEASMALMRRGKRLFKLKHKAFLETRPVFSETNLLAARSRNKMPVVLFIEDTIPLRRLGSGFVRSNDIVHAIASAGYEVHVFPLNGAPYDITSLFGNLPETAEILYDLNSVGMLKFLEERKDIYDLIWIARTHNLDRVLPLLNKAGIDRSLTPIVLDTEAVAACRTFAQAKITRGDFDLNTTLNEEFSESHACRRILAVNELEADLLKNAGIDNVELLGTACSPKPTATAFEDRNGLLFVAGIHRKDSPNLDSLRWYIDEILPALKKKMQKVPTLHVVGYTAHDIDLSPFSKCPGIKLHGEVADLTTFYDTARVFIAPTRFSAGTPYKVYETASFGLPCVATDLLIRQLGWHSGVDIFSAPTDNADMFAHQIAHLYQSEAIWNHIRKNALRRLAAENSILDFNAKVAGIISSVLA